MCVNKKLYSDNSCPSQLQSLAENLQLAGVEGQMDDSKLCCSGEGGTDGKDWSVCACVCGSTHDCGCMVDGSNAMLHEYYYIHVHAIERSVNISITRITRVNNICFCYVVISNDISRHADSQVDS